jgi:hypothetical protein
VKYTQANFAVRKHGTAILRLFSIAITMSLLAGSVWGTATPTAAASRLALTGVNVLGWGLNSITGMASDGKRVWVTTDPHSGPSAGVTELGASTGALLRVISGPSYGFAGATDVVSNGTDVWVANTRGNSITEFSASTGTLVRVILGSQYHFKSPLVTQSPSLMRPREPQSG